MTPPRIRLMRQPRASSEGVDMTTRPTRRANTSADADKPSSIRIAAIAAVPLLGESPKGGWSAEIRPEDSIHALIAVHTDAGITGYGSVFTDGRLVQAALKV